MSNDQPIYNHTGEVPQPHIDPVAGSEAFLEKHIKKIVLASIVAVAAVSVVGMVRYKAHLTAIEAGEMVTAAKTIEDCDLVVQKYPGSVAAGNALLLKADLQWKANKKDSALGTLREFTQNFSSHPFFVSGLMALGSKLEASNEKAEAKGIYERVAKEFGKSEFAPLAQIRIGDLMWADGKDEEAKKFFEALPSQFPGELTVSMSQNRLDLIAAGLPTKEVDGPPPPPKKEEPAPVPGAPGTPGAIAPIKLDSKLGGTPIPVTIPPPPSATITPQGTAITTPAISVDAKMPPKPGPQALPPVPAPNVPPPPADKKVDPKAPPATSAPKPTSPPTPPAPAPAPAPAADAKDSKAPAAEKQVTSPAPATPPAPAPEKK